MLKQTGAITTHIKLRIRQRKGEPGMKLGQRPTLTRLRCEHGDRALLPERLRRVPGSDKSSQGLPFSGWRETAHFSKPPFLVEPKHWRPEPTLFGWCCREAKRDPSFFAQPVFGNTPLPLWKLRGGPVRGGKFWGHAMLPTVAKRTP